jgi:hypothetical protein
MPTRRIAIHTGAITLGRLMFLERHLPPTLASMASRIGASNRHAAPSSIRKSLEN